MASASFPCGLGYQMSTATAPFPTTATILAAFMVALTPSGASAARATASTTTVNAKAAARTSPDPVNLFMYELLTFKNRVALWPRRHALEVLGTKRIKRGCTGPRTNNVRVRTKRARSDDLAI